MYIDGFHKIIGITIDGYCLTNPWLYGDTYTADIVDINIASPLSISYTLTIRSGFDTLIDMTIRSNTTGFALTRSYHREEFDTLSKFTNIYTQNIKSIADKTKYFDANYNLRI
jgi:hypothetical protein